MAQLDRDNIIVLNYNENQVCVDGSNENYNFRASNGIDPTINIMPMKELQFINSNTQIIKTGWLTFEDEFKEEIYKELRIANWEDILSHSDIEEILRNPTIDSLQKIIDITDSTYFDRVRMVMFRLINDGEDITTKVKSVVEDRYKELNRKIRKSNIKLSSKDINNISSDKAKELEQQNVLLQAQLDEMKTMLAQMMAMQTNPVPTPATTTTASTTTVSEKKTSNRATSKKK